MTHTLLDWRTVPLFDSDGGQPDEDQRIRAMREFRDNDCIQDYWFYDSTNCRFEEPDEEDVDSRVWDDFNGEYRESWCVGPSQSQIDFSGLPERQMKSAIARAEEKEATHA